MRKNLSTIIALVLGILLILPSLAACGGGAATGGTGGTAGTPATGDAGAAGAEKMKVALLLPGRKDDVSFNQAMYEGVTAYANAHSEAIDLKIVENVYEVADIEPALTDFADQGYKVIFGHGFQFMEPMVNVADRYPDSRFLLGTGYMFRQNSAIYDVALESGGYLMGFIAALASETGKIGVIGGADASEMVRGHAGYRLGAEAAKPGIEIQEVYTGDWNDTAGAYEAAIGMYDSGVDVIWHSGDGIGLGVVQAAVDKDKYVLGNVQDQKSLGENNVLSGLQYHWEAVIDQIFLDVADGSFLSLTDDQRIYWITIANGGMEYTPFNDTKGTLTQDELTAIDGAYQQLKNDEIPWPVWG
ncbi:MAG: BMP family protein [Peptococcaceae bacterium]|nr:BMP family protein [Peptococcaceae bacterium]